MSPPARSLGSVFTEAPTVLGTDGVRKMSKSVGNTIDVLGTPELIRKQVMSMVTDTQRILRTDPGRPEVCNVCQLQRFFGPDFEELWDGERTARTGGQPFKGFADDCGDIQPCFAAALRDFTQLLQRLFCNPLILFSDILEFGVHYRFAIRGRTLCFDSIS